MMLQAEQATAKMSCSKTLFLVNSVYTNNVVNAGDTTSKVSCCLALVAFWWEFHFKWFFALMISQVRHTLKKQKKTKRLKMTCVYYPRTLLLFGSGLVNCYTCKYWYCHSTLNCELEIQYWNCVTVIKYGMSSDKLHMTLFMCTGDFQPHPSLQYHQTDVSARSSYAQSERRACSCAHPSTHWWQRAVSFAIGHCHLIEWFTGYVLMSLRA